MFLPWTREKRTSIGLDIGRSQVRAVQLQRRANLYTVTAAAAQQRPTERNGAGGQTNHPVYAARGGDRDRSLAIDNGQKTKDAVAGGPSPDIAETGKHQEQNGIESPVLLVRECLRSGLFHGRGTKAALNPPAVKYYPLELPAALVKQRSRDLAQIVCTELSRLTNADFGEFEARYWPLPVTHTTAPNVLAAIAPREEINRFLEVCDQADLQCTGIDATAAALARFGSLLADWPGDAVWGVLDLGAHQAQLVMCVDTVPVLVRRAGSSGGVWTSLIAESLQFSLKAAEVQKCEHGIAARTGTLKSELESAAPAASVSSQDEGETGQEIAAILLSTLKNELRDIAAEIKRSYDYVLSCYPNRYASDLILVGGGATMKHLPAYLGAALGIQVRPASHYLNDVSCRISFASGKQHRFESFATAIGLAIEEC